MRLNSCLWGGRYNPIIPFFEDTPTRWIENYSPFRGLDIARGYIDFFEPDVIVEATAGMANKLGWKHDKHRFDLPRLVSLNEFFTVNNRNRVEFSAGLDVFNVIAHLYDTEYKYQRRHKRPFAFFDATDNAFFELFGGVYPNDESLKYILDAYRDVFEPEALPFSSASYLKFETMDIPVRYGSLDRVSKSRLVDEMIPLCSCSIQRTRRTSSTVGTTA